MPPFKIIAAKFMIYSQYKFVTATQAPTKDLLADQIIPPAAKTVQAADSGCQFLANMHKTIRPMFETGFKIINFTLQTLILYFIFLFLKCLY